MLTGYFLLPVKTGMTDFFKKRFTRVLFPFVVWCLVYSLLPWLTGQTDLTTALIKIAQIPVNTGTEIGHLWYVYMLIGVYLATPVLSPWLQSASRRSIEFYLSLWAVTLLLPYIHLIFPEVWGECYWNGTPMLYYFSGLLGYAVLGYYAKTYWSVSRKWNFPVGLALLVVGYAITYGGFAFLGSRVTMVPDLELTWGYETINVAMMSVGLFLLIKNIRATGKSTVGRLITDISLKSFGIYLIHIIWLEIIQGYMMPLLPDAACGIPVTTVLTFVVSYLSIKLLSYLPGSNYMIG
ncbi:MAG: acyltransferase [Bacteroides sp.]|nr:acyltransferase [Bacteroides sp.]